MNGPAVKAISLSLLLPGLDCNPNSVSGREGNPLNRNTVLRLVLTFCLFICALPVLRNTPASASLRGVTPAVVKQHNPMLKGEGICLRQPQRFAETQKYTKAFRRNKKRDTWKIKHSWVRPQAVHWLQNAI